MLNALAQNLAQNYLPDASNGHSAMPFSLYPTSAPRLPVNPPAIDSSSIQQSSLAAFNSLQSMGQIDLNPRSSYPVMLGNRASMGTIQQGVGSIVNNQMNSASGQSSTRDSSWLKLAVCPTFLAGNCPHSRDDCEGAHPEPNIRMENGTVTVCFDHMKRGECKHPSCKYFHVSDKQKSIVEKQGGSHRPSSSISTTITPGPSASQPINFPFGTTSTSFAHPKITTEALLAALKSGGQSPFPQMPTLNQPPLVPYLQNFAMGQNFQGNTPIAYAPGLPLSDPSFLSLATHQTKCFPEFSIESALNPALGTKRPADNNGSDLLTPSLKRQCLESAPPAMPNQYLSGDAPTSALYSTQPPGGNYSSNSASCSTAYPPSTTNSGRCSRAANCNYLHVENVKNFDVVNNKVQICPDIISSQCNHDKCRRYHIPLEIWAKYVTVRGCDNNEQPSEKMPENAAADLSSTINRIIPTSSSAKFDGEFQSLGKEGAPQSPQSSDHQPL
ncbi:unnamed protein product [Rodentolepis nana]|uniref:C3H1-type domain-containing protein n=1 Tax=Rodentolepis nana TaxID=102285 RepID=A0A0R3TY52_RODNA|nr:unnamed protein product [Rodentolepis nana]